MLIGVDVAEISRFENLSEGFFDKCFTAEERAFFKKSKVAETAAADFAAKEAFSKALGSGVRGFCLKDISVMRKENGKPYFSFSPVVEDILNKICAKNVELSISHDGGMAVAAVVIEQENYAGAFLRAVEKTDTDDTDIISYKLVKSSLKKRKAETHKGDYGRVFVVAGSKGLTGAGIFASSAAVRSGSGLVTLGCCESLNNIFECALAEVMTCPMNDDNGVLAAECGEKIVERANASDVLLIGCGLGRGEGIGKLMEYVIENVKVPVVVDADGINALSGNINILSRAKSPVVLTPHIAEFSRISGLSIDEIKKDTAGAASEFSAKWGVTLVLKSHETVVADEKGCVYKNLLGNCGMATGGSGDVLAGVIASFIGQRLENAVCSGVYIHSLAGDIAADEKGVYGMTPTDILGYIPHAIKLAGER